MTLDTTVAGASADSYLTVEEADAIDAALGMGPESDRWRATSTTEVQREVALRRATRMVDEYVRPASVYSDTQRRRFPRRGDVDDSDVAYIPEDVRHATYHQAVFLLSNIAIIARADARRARDASQASEPNTSYTQADDATSRYSRFALQALAGYGKTEAGKGMVVVSGDSGLGDPYATGVTL